MNADQTAPNGIDQYITGFPPAVQTILETIRVTIRNAVPEATEIISYGMPTFIHNGHLVYFAGYKKHIGFYPAPRGSAEFKDELATYKGGRVLCSFR